MSTADNTTTTAAHNPIVQADLVVPPLHIPDGKGGAYKTELVLTRSHTQVVKLQWWHAADPRREPHNHPWLGAVHGHENVQFVSTILEGGYTETRWALVEGAWRKSVHTYRKGDKNVMPGGVYHTVDAVLPNTVTHMVTGALVDTGRWGYLNPDTGELYDQKPDPDFFDRLCAINPHKRTR